MSVCQGVEVKMFVLTLAAEQRKRKHPVTDRDGSVPIHNRWLPWGIVHQRAENQSSFAIGSLTGRSLYCALGIQ